MYRCKYCGSEDIFVEGTITNGRYTGEPPKKKGGYPTYEIDEWDGIDVWVCTSCKKESEDFDNLAEWVDENVEM